MIMQAKTPRSLPWVGKIAVLGLGVLLLPLFVARAQVPAPPADQQIEVLKATLRAFEKQKQPDDRQIEVLKATLRVLEEKKATLRVLEEKKPLFVDQQIQIHKRIIQDLEEQKRADQAAAEMSGKKPAGELEAEALMRNAKELERVIRQKERELEGLKGKYQAVRAKLAEMSNRKREAGMAPPEADKQKRVQELMGKYNELWKAGKFTEAEAYAKKALELDPDNATVAAAVYIVHRSRQVEHQAVKTQEQRVEQLEQQLQKLIKQVEELHQEMKAKQPPGTHSIMAPVPDGKPAMVPTVPLPPVGPIMAPVGPIKAPAPDEKPPVPLPVGPPR